MLYNSLKIRVNFSWSKLYVGLLDPFLFDDMKNTVLSDESEKTHKKWMLRDFFNWNRIIQL
jgi:hypothetical protein